ncbi:MAG TPA: AarF/ABC1/UbiB kinase family protein [Terriglobia bacterium]|nr:AarF/ABC1/UbiB kinase family protein [Terriglobia bacterium]
MKTNLNDLFAGLPEEYSSPDVLDSDDARERLQAIFADLALKPVPVGSLKRLWTLGELSTQVTLAYIALWMRGWFADAETKQRSEMDTNLRVALKMIHGLGYLRGAATKLGQAFGSLPEILPEQVLSTLDSLHAQAPPMHFSLLREMVRNELGRDPSEIFADFDKQPFAAASIGQVHRATLKSGEDVAVKIQYPGIARAIEADLRNLMALILPMRLTRNWENVKGSCLAVQDMLRQEVDYIREAENMRQARALFGPEDGILVPRVYDEYSTAKVLTSEFLPGPGLKEFLAANPDQSLRDEFGRKMLVAWYRLFYSDHSHSDPHSGNYVFLRDGRLGILDFGCVQHLTASEREVLDRGEAIFDRKITLEELLRVFGIPESDIANPEYLAASRRHNEWLAVPLWNEGPFDFGEEGFFRKGVESLQEAMSKRVTAPPMYLYLLRSIFGWRALGFRLRCRVDQNTIRRTELARRRNRLSH